MTDIAKKLLARIKPSTWVWSQVDQYSPSENGPELTSREAYEAIVGILSCLDLLSEKLDVDLDFGWEPQGLGDGPDSERSTEHALTERSPRDTTPLPPPPRSPRFCEHPKEVPTVCPCDDDCYCRLHSCAGPRGPSTLPPPAGANGPSEP